jgi:fructokinase
MKLIGVDLGGTKIEAAVLGADGRVVWRERVATPRESYDGTIGAITKLVASAEAAAGAVSVGLGIPGALAPSTSVIKNANSTWLNGRPFQADLERALGRSVRMANDANCLAVSEATDGAAAGARIVFAVILGTGTGGGIVIDGKLIVGANAIGGEWGHNSLPWPSSTRDDERPGPRCYCGQHGCIESFLSGPGLAAAYARASGTEGVTPEEVVTRAAAGERAAAECLELWEDRLARGLASVINLIDPDVIVVGGGLSKIERLYVNVPERWGAYVFSDRVVTRLVPAAHGDASGVRGAAWLWKR